MYNVWISGCMVAGAAIVGLGSRFVCKMKADNKVEQAAEKFIKKETGVTIDLSPDKDGADDKAVQSEPTHIKVAKTPIVKKDKKVK